MRYAGFSILIMIFLAGAVDVTVFMKNYEEFADLRVFNSSGLIFEGKIRSGDILNLPPDLYRFELNAMNKTFVRELRISSDQIVEFNLGFTNSTEFLEIRIHSIVHRDHVDEIIIISNKGDLNFEGDLKIPMPKISSFKLLSSNLDFLDFFLSDGNLVFESLLIAENSSGNIRIAYVLEGDTMERKLGREKVILIPLVEVEDFENLEITSFEGQKVYEGSGSYRIKFRFSSFPFAHVAIFMASLALFLIFLSNRGGWK